MSTTERRVLDFDHSAQKLFKPYAGSRPMKLLDLFSKLGDQPEVRTISAALFAAGLFGGNSRLVRAGARMLVAHEAATLAKDALKREIDRTRPRSSNGRKDKKPELGRHSAKELTSFPSGHSAGAIAAARSFSREFPEYKPIAIGAAGLIALGQIPRCAHYPTDVAAGLALGLAAETVVNAGWNALHEEGRAEPPTP